MVGEGVIEDGGGGHCSDRKLTVFCVLYCMYFHGSVLFHVSVRNLGHGWFQ